MSENIELLLERGDRLDDLEEKAGVLNKKTTGWEVNQDWVWVNKLAAFKENAEKKLATTGAECTFHHH